jgi:hypothetical protein
MAQTKSPADPARASSAAANVSRGLQWLWQHLSNVRNPRLFDCGQLHQSTLDVLLLRGAKLYVADLITPAQQSNSPFWLRQEKSTTFLIDDFLAQIPVIPPGTLSAICCWGLLDTLPREALPRLVERLHSYLEPGGVLFGILREPYLAEGADTRWWFETLTNLGANPGRSKPFPYPALTNREVERLFPGGNVKTFLTRSGRREILGIK